MKIECVENPGPHATSTVRNCKQWEGIPFGLVCHEVEQIYYVYHVDVGLWTFRGSKASCQAYLDSLQRDTESDCVTWDMQQSRLYLGRAQLEAFDRAKMSATLL